MIESVKCLLVVFRPRLMLVLSSQSSTKILRLNDKTYYDREGYSWNGYYDWLRNDNMEILGVRMRTDQVPEIQGKLRIFNCVKINGIDVEIYFSHDRDFREGFSVDQDFGENRILVSSDDEYVVTFDTLLLSNTDISRIKNFDVDWGMPMWIT